MHRDFDVPFLSLIIVHNFGDHLGLQKTVGVIQVFERLDITRQDCRAEQAIQDKSAGPLRLQALVQCLPVKIMVPLQYQFHQLVALVGMHAVDHGDPVLRWLLLLIYFDLSVKVALALKVISKIAAPFIEQIVIHGVLFVDWNMLLDLASTQACSFYFNRDHRTLNATTGVVQGIVLRMELALGNGHLGQQPVAALILFAQPPERAGHAVRTHAVAEIDAGNPANFICGKPRRSGHIHLANARRSSLLHLKGDSCLLVRWVPYIEGIYFGRVIAIRFKHAGHALDGGLDLLLGQLLSQPQFAGVHQLRARRWIGRAGNIDGAEEIILARIKNQRHFAIGLALRLNLDAGKTPRIVKGLDACPNLIFIQRLIDLLPNQRLEPFRMLNRSALDLNVRNRSSLQAVEARPKEGRQVIGNSDGRLWRGNSSRPLPEHQLRGDQPPQQDY